MPWHPLRCLGKQNRVWGRLAAACGQHPPPAHGDRRVPLTGHVVPLGRVADAVLGQRAGTGGTWGRFPLEDDGGICGADVDGHGQRVCAKKPGGLFQERPFWSETRCGCAAPARTVAGVVVPQGEGGPAPLRVPAVHGEAVTPRRCQLSWGGTGGAG